MKEIFKPVPYQPFNNRYSISNRGAVRIDWRSPFSFATTDFLKPSIGARGYSCVTMYHVGVKKQAFIHRMVALAFLGEPPKGKGLVRHLDDNKQNNNVENLAWGSTTDNMRDMVEHGRSLTGSKNGRAILNEQKAQEIRELYAQTKISQQKLARRFDVNQTQISRVLRNKVW